MKKLLLMLCLVYAGYHTGIVGDDIQFGMFGSGGQQALEPNAYDESTFGLFDTASERAIKVAEYVQGISPAQLEQQEAEALAAVQLQELLLVRETKRTLRTQHHAPTSLDSGYVSYKLRNRQRKIESAEQAVQLADIKHQQESPVMARAPISEHDQSYQVVHNLEPRDFAYKKQRNKDPKVAQRCNRVRDYSQKYLDVAQRLIDTQTDLVISLRKDLQDARNLAAHKVTPSSALFDYPARSRLS